MRGIRFPFKCSVCAWRGYREDKEDRIDKVTRRPCPKCKSAVIPLFFRRGKPAYSHKEMDRIWAPELDEKKEFE